MYAKSEAIKKAKEDPEYSKRRSIVRHEMKEVVGKLPGYLKRRGSYKSHMKQHLLQESDPRNWKKYN